ncbi:MAG: serine/threonine-protein kinase [Isosphaeraceae bacterium]
MQGETGKTFDQTPDDPPPRAAPDPGDPATPAPLAAGHPDAETWTASTDDLDRTARSSDSTLVVPGRPFRLPAYPEIPGYEIEGELGRGGMGIVYKARQVRLNRTVALKMILADDPDRHEDAVRFLAEAEAAARLQHPNIVQVYHFAQHDGNAFFAMEFVGGGNLAARLNGSPLPPLEAAGIMQAVAAAMAEAHRRGIVHRDLKPGNILLTTDGVPKVADFGLAKQLNVDSGLTRTDVILGTPSYMAPEQAEGRAAGVGPPADIHALGAILYEMLTGCPPFRGTTPLSTLHHVRWVDPVPPSRLVSGLPRDLETICLKCLQKEPARRYASAAELADDLERLRTGRPILARPVGPLERGWRWCLRNPLLAVSLGATAAALVAVAAISTAFAANRVEAVRESNLRLAALEYDRAQDACEEGRIGQGLLRFVESWRLARAAGDRGIARQRAARASLSAWRARYPELKALFSLDGEALACFSPDGGTVFTGGSDRTARFWDVATSRPLGGIVTLESSIQRPAYRPDGKVVAVACEDGAARFLEAGSGTLVGAALKHGNEPLWDVAFSPDGRTVATGSQDGTARLWDAATGGPVGVPLKHPGPVTSVRFSPDGETILTGCEDGSGRLWEAATRRLREPILVHGAPIWGVAYSPDSKRLVTCGFDKKARVWDAATGRPARPPLAHPAWVTRAAFSPDGAWLATGSFDGKARLWDAATGRVVGPTYLHQGTIWNVDISPDGKNLLTDSKDQTARVWDVAASAGDEGRLLPTSMRSHSLDAAFSPDGRTVVAGFDDGARLWDATTGEPRDMVLRHEGAPVNRVAFSPDGASIATGSVDGTARLWNVATGRRIGPPLPHEGWVTALEFSPDGKTLLTGSFDGKARLWDRTSGLLVIHPLVHGSQVYAVGFSPDGKTILTGGLDMSARLWGAATGRPVHGPLRHEDLVTDSAFSPDGRVVVTASWDKNVRFWDVASGRALDRRLLHQAPVLNVAFSPDGRALLTGSADGRVRLWDTATGEPLGPPLVEPPADDPDAIERPISGVVFSPDGKTVLVGVKRTLRLLDIPPAVEDDVDRVATWIEATTGLHLDESRMVRVLDHEQWLQRRDRTQRQGGPPLFAPDPPRSGVRRGDGEP